jgi:hypothetical protein
LFRPIVAVRSKIRYASTKLVLQFAQTELYSHSTFLVFIEAHISVLSRVSYVLCIK